MPNDVTPPKVFISYSHDTPAHYDCVLKLSDTLREWGIDCHIDQYELAPADWVRWMERRIRESDFVVIVCTETYCRRFNGQEEPGKGLGVRHEGGVISAELYNRQSETAKFIPVLFSTADAAHIPTPLQTTHRHLIDPEQLETDRGFENLYRHLTRQPRVVPRVLGERRLLQNFIEDLGKGIKLEMIAVSGGTFLMGSDDGRDNEKPVHLVRISPFHIGKYQVTQAQWEVMMDGNNPSHEGQKGHNRPVNCVLWRMAIEFCEKLSKQTGMNYRLPTEAEWEYACRAGSTGKYCFGDDETLLEKYAWYDLNSERKPQPVGQKEPNVWGIYDMHGNIKEWCHDWYDKNYYKRSPTVNPQGPSSGKTKVLRGGSWFRTLDDARCAARHEGDKLEEGFYGRGFRVVCEAKISKPLPFYLEDETRRMQS